MVKLSNKMIESVIQETVGNDGFFLVSKLKNKKNVSEFKIAETIKRPINETRNILYRLYHKNLVTFIRKKDKQKGWYIYYWTFNPKQIKYLAKVTKEKKIEKLKERLEREKDNYFFQCESGCIRLDFEQSTEFEFKCPECGRIMHQENNESKISEIKEEIRLLEKELKK